MLFGLQISEDDFDKDCTEERVLDYIQYLFNAIIFVQLEIRQRKYTIYQASESIAQAIIDNSHLILDRIGAEIIDEGHEFVVLYKNDIAHVVANQQPAISSSIREYLKIDNRGDLDRKSDIICTLAKELELIEGRLKGAEFSALFSDTTMLLNKLGIRHAFSDKDAIGSKFCKFRLNGTPIPLAAA